MQQPLRQQLHCAAPLPALQAFDRGVEERFQREMGTAAQLARTDAYMRTNTLAHTALVDPTSR